ncbi:uncharacterized protein A4U43_C05F12920 [Asparagus officinalis]|uniref:Uncharacterized protein n=1 Tax=Asparagus officinalis TaxID=4686 RepID=A0A5P1ER93_ASPOF|nr:uncharacterized protein A4U43_C05F12920 [Asparagus officinalis]
MRRIEKIQRVIGIIPHDHVQETRRIFSQRPHSPFLSAGYSNTITQRVVPNAAKLSNSCVASGSFEKYLAPSRGGAPQPAVPTVMAKISLSSSVVAVLMLFSAMEVSGQEMAPAPSPFAGAANGLLPVSAVAVCFSILFAVIAPSLFSR